MNFERFAADIKENNWNVFGVEVYENSVLTHSYGDTCDGIHDIYSATKSVLSVAFGIAYDMGLVDVQKSILEYLPEDKVKGMPEAQRKVFEKITLHRLLTMSVGGFPFRPEGEQWLDYCLACEIPNPDERVFNYSNINVFLIGVALTRVLGCDLGEFIKEKIFEPLEITHFKMQYSPDGYFHGASGMQMCVHDLSKFGILMSNGGTYNGTRIISDEYASMATSIQQMNREGGYGFYFWKYRDGFSINGKFKQKCYCLPKQRIIVTYLAHIEDNSHDLLNSMERNILGIEKSGLPTREQAEQLVRESEELYPGPWGDHSRTAAYCAEAIASRCPDMDADKAYIVGLLHDIGRRFGHRHMGHVSDGYLYMTQLGYDEVARICLTHSFNTHSFDDYIGKRDTSEDETDIIRSELEKITEFDDYDRLIQLCDSLSGPGVVMNQEDRMNDVKTRYGNYAPQKWDANINLRKYFEQKMGADLYEVIGQPGTRCV